MAKTSPNDVVARYGNWYHGDDDLFAHALVLRSGLCVQLYQGLQTVTVKTFKAPAAKINRLRALLKAKLPDAWPNASYAGYNFITDAEGPSANEIAVWGVRASDMRPPGQYYAAPPDSEIGMLVKAIAKVD
jgi:hypothetical protein